MRVARRLAFESLREVPSSPPGFGKGSGSVRKGEFGTPMRALLDQAVDAPVTGMTRAEALPIQTRLIPSVDIRTVATVNDIDEQIIQERTGAAEDGCPLVTALRDRDIERVGARIRFPKEV